MTWAICLCVEMPDRTNGPLSPVLPLSSKDNIGTKSKEENIKLLNGNSGDNIDWVSTQSGL